MEYPVVCVHTIVHHSPFLSKTGARTCDSISICLGVFTTKRTKTRRSARSRAVSPRRTQRARRRAGLGVVGLVIASCLALSGTGVSQACCKDSTKISSCLRVLRGEFNPFRSRAGHSKTGRLWMKRHSHPGRSAAESRDLPHRGRPGARLIPDAGDPGLPLCDFRDDIGVAECGLRSSWASLFTCIHRAGGYPDRPAYTGNTLKIFPSSTLPVNKPFFVPSCASW